MQSGDTASTIDPLGLGGTILATIAALLILVSYTSLILGWWKPIETEAVTERASDPFADFEPFVTGRPTDVAHRIYTNLPARSSRRAVPRVRTNTEVPCLRLPETPPAPVSEPHPTSSAGQSSGTPNATSPDGHPRDDPGDDASTVMSLTSTIPPSYRSTRSTYPNKRPVPSMGPAVGAGPAGVQLPISYPPPSAFSQSQGTAFSRLPMRGHTRPRGERPRKAQDGGVRLAGGPLGAVASGLQEQINEDPFEDPSDLSRVPSTRPPSYCALEESYIPAPMSPPSEQNETRVDSL
ncbi:hypothetical protein GY45DRAFT_1135023 [Cubamyces sp. BRFM 1775]|nr:hypothetical protein GY45DRAFT_1135023 [Cubamyces sp. BRFM 1775]